MDGKKQRHESGKTLMSISGALKENVRTKNTGSPKMGRERGNVQTDLR
jgi:hypothetical protein